MFEIEAENDQKEDIVPVDLSRSEPEILSLPLNAILKDPEEFQMRYDRELDNNDKIAHDYHFNE